MSFCCGFEKTSASIPGAIGAVRGTAAKVTKGISAGIKKFVGGQKAKGISSYRSASGVGSKMAPGEGLAAGRARRAQASGKGSFTPKANDARETKARSDVYARKTKVEDAKSGNKPSFARKHPFITAGALYLGTKSALSGGDKEQSQQPQYIGPQQ